MKKKYTGFGYHPPESDGYFDVVIRAGPQGAVRVYECFALGEARSLETRPEDILKVELTKERWDKPAPAVTAEFNRRLRMEKKPAGRFITGHNPVERMMGMELLVLLWGTEYEELEAFPAALRNWLGLRPEERRWLYTVTNESAGRIHDRNGWRAALRYILCENPVNEGSDKM